jgi:hypothetical protein
LVEGRREPKVKNMSNELEARFDEAMMDVYRRALSECGYNATRFLHMLYEHRGLETARILLRASKVSEGYIALWERVWLLPDCRPRPAAYRVMSEPS